MTTRNPHAPGEVNAPCREVLDRLAADLIGPAPLEGTLPDVPSEAFMTGVLFPGKAAVEPEEEAATDVDLAAPGDEDGTGAAERPPRIEKATRPAAAGLSFALATDCIDGQPFDAEVSVTISGARYIRDEGEIITDREGNPRLDEDGVPKRETVWLHRPLAATLHPLDVRLGRDVALEAATEDRAFRGLVLTIVASPYAGGSDAERVSRLVTLVVHNEGDPFKDGDRFGMNEQCLFEFQMTVRAGEGSVLTGRPVRGRGEGGDDADAAAALLWRDVVEYAVGHTCAAHWEAGPDGVEEISTAWLPATRVPATSAKGHGCFAAVRERLVAEAFADPAREAETLEILHAMVTAYEDWIVETRDRIPRDVLPPLQGQAHKHLTVCADAARRMRGGVAALESDPALMRAFRFANLAMHRQQDWRPPKEGQEKRALAWRPFQIGFFLLSAASTINPDNEERVVMDLIWFPTGGGKTEAYLLLTAFTIFARRLKRGERGQGVCAFMRYTLRLLTLQQFERAAAMICAANVIWKEEGYNIEVEPISLGLWLGGTTTPNKREDAVALLRGETRRDVGTPKRLHKCPECHTDLYWLPNGQDVEIRCNTPGCSVGEAGPLPLYTNDADVYDQRPSLVIGTADKFAQIARNKKTEALFGARHDRYDPPDLIVQDELHLISGPLGTQTGLYETAIDALCTKNGRAAKVIGSTATIRRASEQVRALFARKTMQFPPPGIDADDSAFAVVDKHRLGRLYVGVSTIGHSKPEMLQAVCASLLQSATVLKGAERDACWTLLGYFNSLKELGGSVTLLQAIAPETMRRLARYHDGGVIRKVGSQIEVTSRIPSDDIGRVLESLSISEGKPGAVDVALATNMISVGVDVDRLGLMVVDGQPKGISEYIQATSRVGRGEVPGLVIGLFTAYRPRDRSRFETHRTWHDALYRDVESSSVTPFAPRARDRALHAPFVAIAAHENTDLWQAPAKAADLRTNLEAIIDRIIDRVDIVDPDETAATRAQLEAFLEQWTRRDGLTIWWDDKGDRALLMSSEQAAQRQAAGRDAKSATPTPNSMRGVEATVRIDLERF